MVVLPKVTPPDRYTVYLVNHDSPEKSPLGYFDQSLDKFLAPRQLLGRGEYQNPLLRIFTRLYHLVYFFDDFVLCGSRKTKGLNTNLLSLHLLIINYIGVEILNETRGKMQKVIPDSKVNGTWKVRLFPPPVGIQTNTSLPSMVHLIMAFWLFLNSLILNLACKTWYNCLSATSVLLSHLELYPSL